MKNLIGGLFETQENANLAYQALEKSGSASDEIHMFVHKPRRRTARSTNVRIQDIARNALLGGVIGGGIGAFLGFLVGIGVIPLPYLEPSSAAREPLFIFMAIAWGVITGGVPGVILGVASKLLRSQEKAEVMTRQIEKRGVLVTVIANDAQTDARVRNIMKEHQALEVGNPAEKWDLEAWSSPNEQNPSLKNLADTR
jgi:hypothetical protein